MTLEQGKVFVQEEGDAWFKRNAGKLRATGQAMQSEEVQYILKTLAPFASRMKRVLEIGCSNGLKLEALCDQFNAAGVGVDPSSAAVQAGNMREKTAELTLHVGTSDKLLCESRSFDLVHFAFCLYLVDRNALMQSLAEADRVLKPGGFLVITDFDPSVGHKRPYSHYEGLFSYKQDYAAFYTNSALYHLVGKHSYSHNGSSFDESPDERVATSVLYKEAAPYLSR